MSHTGAADSIECTKARFKFQPKMWNEHTPAIDNNNNNDNDDISNNATRDPRLIAGMKIRPNLDYQPSLNLMSCGCTSHRANRTVYYTPLFSPTSRRTLVGATREDRWSIRREGQSASMNSIIQSAALQHVHRRYTGRCFRGIIACQSNRIRLSVSI